MNINDLVIDPEFEQMLPPLTQEEFEGLEAEIVHDGKLMTPITLWGNIIVDGHNRYNILKKHPEIELITEQREFSDRWDVICWIIEHQRNRRNLTDMQRTDLLGRYYQAKKHKHGGDRGNQYTKVASVENQHLPNSQKQGKVRTEIAKEFGVGATKVYDAYKFSQGIDAIREQDPALADSILKAEKRVTKADVMSIATAKDENRTEMIEELKQDKPKPIRTAKPKPGKTKEEREADEQLKKNISNTVDQLVNGTPIEATVDDLLSLIQDVADAAVSSLRSILNSQKKIVTGNKETITESIADIFSRAIEKVKENLQ